MTTIYKVVFILDISKIEFLQSQLQKGESPIKEGPASYYFLDSKDELDKVIEDERKGLLEDGFIIKDVKIMTINEDEYLNQAFNEFIDLAAMRQLNKVDQSLTPEEGIMKIKGNKLELCKAVNNFLLDLQDQLDEELFSAEEIQ